MAERKAKPAAKKVAVTKAASKASGKPKITKAALAAMPKKAAVKPKTTKTSAVKKTTAPAAVKKAPAQKAVATKAKPAAKKAVTRHTPEERYCMVQTAAYFIAERDGFCGCPTAYWAAAELEIASRLG